MSAYNSLLKSVPVMRVYDAAAKMAPKSGFAKKVRAVKGMAAKQDAAAVAKKAKTVAKKPKAKLAKKTNPDALIRGGGSTTARRSLLNP